MTNRKRKRTEAAIDGDGGLKSKPGRSAITAAMTDRKRKRTEAAIDDDGGLKSKPGPSVITAAMTNRKRKRTEAAIDDGGDLKSKPGPSVITAAMTNRKRKKTEAAIDDDGDGGLKSKPVSQKSQTMPKKKPMKQTGDKSGSVLGDNQIEDVRWLCSLSESELDLLVCLKMMVLRRAKKIDPKFANKIDLKVLRDLSFTMMKNLKDELKKDHLSPSRESTESWVQIAESNLSQVDVKEKFSSMTNEELRLFICPDNLRKRNLRKRMLDV